MASAVPLIPANQPNYGDPQVSLDKALENFKSSVQQYILTKALSQANEQVRAIQSSAIKEQDKMAAMNDIARALTFNMVRTGVNPHQIEQAAGMVKQKPIATADEAILRGSLAGDAGLIQRGLQADYLSAANKLAVLEAQQRKNPALKQADMD